MDFTNPQAGVSLGSPRRRRAMIPVLGALFMVLSVAEWAHAAPITIVSGGFTAFNGLAATTDGVGGVTPGCDADFQSYVGGSILQAASCPTSLFFGPAAVTFPSMLTSLEFYERQFVSCDPSPCDPYADAPHNNFTFTKWTTTTQDVADPTKDAFVLGTLAFTNGTWFGSGKVNSVHLEITAQSSAFGTQTLSDDVMLDIRVGSTPMENADCFSFAHFAALGTVCAYEPNVPGQSNTTSVLVWGVKGSLIPTKFTDVQGGFLVADATAAVPEPASLVLLGTGLAALAAHRRRKSLRIRAASGESAASHVCRPDARGYVVPAIRWNNRRRSLSK